MDVNRTYYYYLKAYRPIGPAHINKSVDAAPVQDLNYVFWLQTVHRLCHLHGTGHAPKALGKLGKFFHDRYRGVIGENPASLS